MKKGVRIAHADITCEAAEASTLPVGEFGPGLILAHWQRSGFSSFTGYVRERHPYTFVHPFRSLFSSHPNQRVLEFFFFHTIVVFQNNTWGI